MEEILVTRINAGGAARRIDYNALANKPNIDNTLKESGQPADAKKVGEEIEALKTSVNNVTLKKLGVNVDATELNYMDGVTGNVQTQLDAKQPKIKGAASTIVDAMITPDSVLISDSSGYVGVSSISATELGYLSGVIGNIQGQLDDKIGIDLADNFSSITSLWQNTTPSDIFAAQNLSIEGICDGNTYQYLAIISDHGSVVMANKAGTGYLSYNTFVNNTEGGGMLNFHDRSITLSDGVVSFGHNYMSSLHASADAGTSPLITFSSEANANNIPYAVLGISGVRYHLTHY